MTRLSPAQAEFLRWARVARLATTARDGTPHVVPVCPALDGDDVIVALMAESVKLRNVRGEARVALVVDDYREDWDANAGLMVHGSARFLEGAAWKRGRGLLYAKFTQYEHLAPIERDAIVSIAIDRIASWGV